MPTAIGGEFVSRVKLRPIVTAVSVANFADRSAWCKFAGNGFGGEHVMIEFKGSHFERDVILWAVRWYVAYPISYRRLEEMMEEHGVEVDPVFDRQSVDGDRSCFIRERENLLMV